MFTSVQIQPSPLSRSQKSVSFRIAPARSNHSPLQTATELYWASLPGSISWQNSRCPLCSQKSAMREIITSHFLGAWLCPNEILTLKALSLILETESQEMFFLNLTLPFFLPCLEALLHSLLLLSHPTHSLPHCSPASLHKGRATCYSHR